MDGQLNHYDFKGLKWIYYTNALIDDTEHTLIGEGIVNSHTHVHLSDDNETLTLEAQIYIYNHNITYYQTNPIYQKSNGEVYVTPGDSYSYDRGLSPAEGSLFSIEFSEEHQTLDGKKQSTLIKIEFMYELPVSEVTVIEMDAQHRVIQSQDIDIQQKTITLSKDTEYIVVEFTKSNQNILRKVYDKHDETIQFFVDEEQPALSGKLLNLDWN